MDIFLHRVKIFEHIYSLFNFFFSRMKYLENKPANTFEGDQLFKVIAGEEYLFCMLLAKTWG
jgi:hypothetical protein